MPSENQLKNNSSKIILTHTTVSAVFFFIGFYTHSLLMTPPPGILIEQKQNIQDLQAGLKQKLDSTSTVNQNISEVVSSFDGVRFNPSEIIVPISLRVKIINESKTELMRLISEYKVLNTLRGYGYTEQILQVMNERGTYFVYVENKPQAVLKITVE
jgi:hypothetical protein